MSNPRALMRRGKTPSNVGPGPQRRGSQTSGRHAYAGNRESPSGAKEVAGVSLGVLLQIILVILLGRRKRTSFFDLGDDGG